MSFLVIGSSKVRPMRRLMAKKVRSGFVTAWRLAGWPTRRSPSSVNATIEGVVRMPSAFSMTRALAPSITATQELVVPRSMPITFAIFVHPSLSADRRRPGATTPWPGSGRDPGRSLRIFPLFHGFGRYIRRSKWGCKASLSRAGGIPAEFVGEAADASRPRPPRSGRAGAPRRQDPCCGRGGAPVHAAHAEDREAVLGAHDQLRPAGLGLRRDRLSLPANSPRDGKKVAGHPVPASRSLARIS